MCDISPTTTASSSPASAYLDGFSIMSIHFLGKNQERKKEQADLLQGWFHYFFPIAVQALVYDYEIDLWVKP